MKIIGLSTLFMAGVWLGLILSVSGCSQPDKNGLNRMGGSVVTPISAATTAGQEVVTISYDDLKSWLESHKDIKICSVTSIDRDNYGMTTAFLIVYEKAISDTCTSCGQKVPVEKKP